ncbi:MAG: 4Fe-4S dicluster domain-containing protein [Thermoleophilia bacterium]|nr:4Fe-4S dicluster domain-containing protein [Thermoleophilia bacterium]
MENLIVPLPAPLRNRSGSPGSTGEPIGPARHLLVCQRAAAALNGGEHKLEGHAVTVPCLLGTPPGYLATFALPGEPLELRTGCCEACPNGANEGVAWRRLEALCASVPDLTLRRGTSGTLAGEDVRNWGGSTVTRKGLFAAAGVVLSGMLLARLPVGLARGILAQSDDLPQRDWSRRSFLDRLDRSAVLSGDEARAIGLGSIEAAADAVCDGCGLCMRSCPKGALVLGDEGLMFEAGRCVGCDVCVQRCPRGALAVAESLPMHYVDATLRIMGVMHRRCGCGAPAEPGLSSCLSCARSAELIGSLPSR